MLLGRIQKTWSSTRKKDETVAKCDNMIYFPVPIILSVFVYVKIFSVYEY